MSNLTYYALFFVRLAIFCSVYCLLILVFANVLRRFIPVVISSILANILSIVAFLLLFSLASSVLGFTLFGMTPAGILMIFASISLTSIGAGVVKKFDKPLRVQRTVFPGLGILIAFTAAFSTARDDRRPFNAALNRGAWEHILTQNEETRELTMTLKGAFPRDYGYVVTDLASNGPPDNDSAEALVAVTTRFVRSQFNQMAEAPEADLVALSDRWLDLFQAYSEAPGCNGQPGKQPADDPIVRHAMIRQLIASIHAARAGRDHAMRHDQPVYGSNTANEIIEIQKSIAFDLAHPPTGYGRNPHAYDCLNARARASLRDKLSAEAKVWLMVALNRQQARSAYALPY